MTREGTRIHHTGGGAHNENDEVLKKIDAAPLADVAKLRSSLKDAEAKFSKTIGDRKYD